jgi:hypothetical protein
MLYGDRLEMEKWIAVVDGRFVVVGVKFYPTHRERSQVFLIASLLTVHSRLLRLSESQYLPLVSAL